MAKMARRTGPTNPYLNQLIDDLKSSKAPVWKAVAKKLSKLRRQKVEVNLADIDRHTAKGETVVVPGVVLASGQLTKAVNVAAWRFSAAARKKIEKIKGKALTIDELVKENPKGKNVKIVT